MNFDGMTPQQAAQAIFDEYTGFEIKKPIAAACEHFYARGIVDGRNVRDEQAMAIIREAADTIRKAREE